MPRMRHEERQALTREQLTSLIEHLKSPARELVAFLSMTGLRKSELQGLRWKRVNLTDKPILCDGQPLAPHCIAIREQYLRVYGKHLKVDRGQWQDLKTREQGMRDIPLSFAAVELLQKIYAGVGVDGDTQRGCVPAKTEVPVGRVEGQRMATAGNNPNQHSIGPAVRAAGSEPARQQPNPDDPVFQSRNGTPINSDNVLRRHVKPVLIALGLPSEIDLHSMRHTQATLADQAGATPAERQKILGHASARMTMRYTSVELERVRPAIETASEGIGEALRKPATKVLELKRRKTG
jgi:integrase